MTVGESFPAVFIMGPTASGKTGLALELADRHRVMLINVDSTQVYKRLNIGAAKPSAEELARAPHHLLDIREPWQPYTVGEFCQDAALLIRQARAENRLPVLVGGSMMYFRALQFGLSDLPASSPQSREFFQGQLKACGLSALREQLREVDPQTVDRVEAADTQRILRALEVWRDTGRSLSDWHKSPPVPLLPLDVLPLALWPEPRSILHQRIADRFASMMAQGFEQEVRGLIEMPEVHEALPAMRSVGYRQILAHIRGESTLEQAIELGVIATRQLAKRQYTWLRGWPDVQYLNPFEAERTVLQEALAAMQAWNPDSFALTKR